MSPQTFTIIASHHLYKNDVSIFFIPWQSVACALYFIKIRIIDLYQCADDTSCCNKLHLR